MNDNAVTLILIGLIILAFLLARRGVKVRGPKRHAKPERPGKPDKPERAKGRLFPGRGKREKREKREKGDDHPGRGRGSR